MPLSNLIRDTTLALSFQHYPFDPMSTPPRRSAHHRSSSEEGWAFLTRLLVQEGWRLGGRGGCPRWGVFPQPLKAALAGACREIPGALRRMGGAPG